MKDPRHFVYRVLALRLAVVAVVLVAVVVTTVYFTLRNDVGNLVLDRAYNGADSFAFQVRPILDASDEPDARAISRELEAFVNAPRASIDPFGEFVSVRIRSNSEVLLAAFDRPEFSYHKDTNIWLQEPMPKNLAKRGIEVKRIAGRPYVRVQALMLRSNGARAAYADAVFQLSEEAISEIRRRLVQVAVFSSMLIVAVTLMLYPVIIRFLRRILRLSVQLLDANLGMVRLLGSAIAQKDSDTDIHNYRVTLYAIALGEKMELHPPTMRRLIKGAFLHDIGKLGVPDAVLKKPGPLQGEEWEEMRRHVTYGLNIVSRLGWLQEASEVIGNHHERYDGSGYHDGLKGDEIPITARIFAIVDVFDALMSKRPYKDPIPFAEGMEILLDSRGKHFDPEVLDVFLEHAREWYQEVSQSDIAGLTEALRKKTSQYFREDLVSFA